MLPITLAPLISRPEAERIAAYSAIGFSVRSVLGALFHRSAPIASPDAQPSAAADASAGVASGSDASRAG